MVRKVFIDTGAFIALSYQADQYHSLAVEALHTLNRYPFITTDHIVGETFTWLRYKVGFETALAFLRQIDMTSLEGQLRVVHADQDLLWATREILKKFTDQTLSFADGLSLALLEADKSITDVFAFDTDLLLAGRTMYPGNFK